MTKTDRVHMKDLVADLLNPAFENRKDCALAPASTCRSTRLRNPSELLARRPTAASNGQVMATLRAEIRRYEEQYGVPSDRLEEAVKSGELIENLEVCDWLILYTLLLRAETR